MKTSLTFLISALALAHSASALTYQLSDFGTQNGFFTSGFISTDGTLGAITDTNITGWSITSTDGSDTLNFDSSFTNHEVRTHSTSLFATTDSISISEGSVLVFLLNRPGRDLAIKWERRLDANLVPNNSFDMRDDEIPVIYFDTDPFFTENPQAIAAIPEPTVLTLIFVGSICALLRLSKNREMRSNKALQPTPSRYPALLL